MAGASLFALLDDIATLLDDVAVLTKAAAGKTSAVIDDVTVLTKAAAGKTAGVLGDDLALNAQQVAGVNADRELPVVWAVAKGSAINKLILVPIALILSAFAPFLVLPLLMIGGVYLCFEGCEKLAHKFLHDKAEDEANHRAITHALLDPQVDMVALEKSKIRGAIRTDFILSAEIIVIALGTVRDAPFLQRTLTVCGIAVLMTIGVYALVAAIVKLDDLGVLLMRNGAAGSLRSRLGSLILTVAPKLMKALSILGTAAMFLVGGGIIVHAWPAAHHLQEHLAEVVGTWPAGGFWAALSGHLFNAIAGLVAGAIVLILVHFAGKLRRKK